MSQTSHIFFDESSTLTDEMLEELDMMLPTAPTGHVVIVPRASWYKRNEAKIVLFIFALTLLGLYLTLPHIGEIMWYLSTPITHLIGGQ